jgi:DNA replication protein DnaC
LTAGNLKNFFRDESANWDITELIETFSKVRILLIDDLGMEYDGSGFTSKTLRNIIDNRMSMTNFIQDFALESVAEEARQRLERVSKAIQK